MRLWSLVLIAVALLTVGCTREIAGLAQSDPRGPATSLSGDGFGIIAGDPKAPIQVELFTEPQCSHCADLQREFGPELAHYMDMGQLAVTYRPLTFFDETEDGYSARVSNALFLTVVAETSAKVFQKFVEHLWDLQPAHGGEGLTSDQIADVARRAGVTQRAVDAIRAGTPALDTGAMSDTNYEYLYEIDPLNTGTPTVYDLKKEAKLDIYDNNWLSKLMST
jgi:hypothetical protein